MRSFGEIRFRFWQELGNLRLLLLPSDRGASPEAQNFLPDPASFLPRLTGTAYAESIQSLAESILSHRFPLLGYVIETGPDIRWRRDYIRGIETGTQYFRRIRYLDPAAVGDHKTIWELNRHQHLVVLAQAWRLTGESRFPDEIVRQIESWWRQNPFMRGINWVSALEVAFRALSWIWIEHLCGRDLPPDFRQRLSRAILHHGAYLENNLSIYFSPNTHLLGEAVALHAIGAVFPDDSRSARWRKIGGEIVSAAMMNQVRADGSHFEQSSAYHVYALDFFLFDALLRDAGQAYRERLRKMADYLAALSSEDGCIPLLGDDDGGSLFHPFGDQRRRAARTLAACCVYFGTEDWPCHADDLVVQGAWWMGDRAFDKRSRSQERSCAPHLFADAGVAVLSKAPAHIAIDTRGFGHAGAGHSHAHALSVVCRYKGHDVLIDPGTYTYTAEPEWRARFRGTAFHNTVRVDGLDQAAQSGPFRWANKPAVDIVHWVARKEWCYLHAVCDYRDIRHERHFVWLALYEALVVVDVVKSANSHDRPVEQFWHCGDNVSVVSPCVWRIGETALLAAPASGKARIESEGVLGWQSEAPGKKIPRPVIVIEQRTALPAVMGAMLLLQPGHEVAFNLEVAGAGIIVRAGNRRSIELGEKGEPLIAWD